MLQLASANGIDTIDTAIGYGDSESCLGAAGIQAFRVVTKLPQLPPDVDDGAMWISRQVVGSLKRLGVTQLYGLLLHSPEQLLGPNGKLISRALQGLKDSGQIRKIGVSVYSPSDLEFATKILRPDLVQAPLNLVDRRFHTSGWMQRLKDNGVEIHVRSVFLQGLLLLPLSAIPKKFLRWHDLWARWHRWLGDHHLSALQACLMFPHSFPQIDRIVVGADSVGQLAQIVHATVGGQQGEFPDLDCECEDLINPARWALL